jgi:hypothetical protein
MCCSSETIAAPAMIFASAVIFLIYPDSYTQKITAHLCGIKTYLARHIFETTPSIVFLKKTRYEFI